jgi:hypothetical protein
MAMTANEVNSFKLKKGDSNYDVLTLKDYFPGRKSSGVHARFTAQSGMEAFAASLTANCDIVCYGFSGKFQGMDKALLNASISDTTGDSRSVTYTVKGKHPTTNETLSAVIYLKKMVKPTKIQEIAVALKGLDWYSDDGQKLTEVSVTYPQTA